MLFLSTSLALRKSERARAERATAEGATHDGGADAVGASTTSRKEGEDK